MNDPEIDRIFSNQDEIQPSSGFLVSVMDAVRREAAAPPPIPFPWKFALPCLALAVVALGLVVVAGFAAFEQLSHTTTGLSLPADSIDPLALDAHGPIGAALRWTGLSLLVAFVSVKLSMRLAGARA